MTKPNKKQPDVVIVGGGMVGMAAAIALSQLKLSVVLLEFQQSQADSHPSYDDRTLVVNRASICFWKKLGIWPHLKQDITEIHKVHVSNKGHFGHVVFSKEEFKIDSLASIVEAKVLGMALKNKIQSLANIELICPAQVTGFTSCSNYVEIDYSVGEQKLQLRTSLMLAADGVQSKIRQKLQLATEVKSYKRTAIICNITTEYKHNNCAYERLTSTGPTALLPFVQNRCGFVWSVKSEAVDEIINLSDAAFLKQAQEQFGYRLGKFLKAGKRSTYPLYWIKVPQQCKDRIILMGNAAHAMSPVSAQGLNLAVRDIAHLYDVIKQNLDKNQDIGDNTVLNHYQQSVNEDQEQTMAYTDDLMRWFEIDNPIVNSLRSLALFAMNTTPLAKETLFHKASGYRHDSVPELLRHY